jgi:hypothetical protein
VKERVDDCEAVKVLAGLQILGEKEAAGSRLRCGDNKGIPKGELIAVLNFPASFQQAAGNSDRFPNQEISNLGASVIDGGQPFLANLDVKLLKNLKT